ncbi:MAG: 50S ribosomal protein L10 [Pirellulaceae bacterium]
MSKVVKDILTSDIARRLEGVQDCVVANVIGLDSEKTVVLRRRLREKNIGLMVVKNSLARRATEGTPLAPAFSGLTGPAAVLYGGEDFVSLVKEVTELDKDSAFESFTARGGVMDGEALTPESVKAISKWPSRSEQLSLLMGQILGPGSTLGGQLIGVGGQLASQIEKIGKGEE